MGKLVERKENDDLVLRARMQVEVLGRMNLILL